jgi:hypothetical protein
MCETLTGCLTKAGDRAIESAECFAEKKLEMVGLGSMGNSFLRPRTCVAVLRWVWWGGGTRGSLEHRFRLFVGLFGRRARALLRDSTLGLPVDLGERLLQLGPEWRHVEAVIAFRGRLALVRLHHPRYSFGGLSDLPVPGNNSPEFLTASAEERRRV